MLDLTINDIEFIRVAVKEKLETLSETLSFEVDEGEPTIMTEIMIETYTNIQAKLKFP